jgi:hypothetical protein
LKHKELSTHPLSGFETWPAIMDMLYAPTALVAASSMLLLMSLCLATARRETRKEMAAQHWRHEKAWTDRLTALETSMELFGRQLGRLKRELHAARAPAEATRTDFPCQHTDACDSACSCLLKSMCKTHKDQKVCMNSISIKEF